MSILIVSIFYAKTMSAVNAIHTKQYEIVHCMGLGVLLQDFIRQQIPGSRCLLGKLILLRMVEKFPTFHGPRQFVTASNFFMV